MSTPASYCEVARGHPLHGPFHDHEHGFPVRGDDALFERLLLEINQAGLAWATILAKRASLRAAYHDFYVDAVAAFDGADVARLRHDPGVIRHAGKISAAIHNASVVQRLRQAHGSFAAWLDAHHPRDPDAWVRLFKQTFHFTGGSITREFLTGVGYLPGAHDTDCPVAPTVRALQPPWLTAP